MERKANLTIAEIFERIKHCMENEDIQTPEFRALIAVTEVGDIVKYITHDPEINPGARPHGTKKDEALAYGQALVQTLAALYLRGIDPEEAFELGLRNWEDADWRKCQAKKKETGKLIGIGVVPGTVTGTVYVLDDIHTPSDIPPGSILVAQFTKPDLVEFMNRVAAIVTNHGGATSHAANIAREKGVVAIVGTGNATEVLKHGQRITLSVGKTGHNIEAQIVIEK